MLATAPYLAVFLVAVATFAWCWRARERYGMSRKLPPGSFSFLSSLRALRDYDFYREQSARHGPVFKTSQYLRPTVCVVGLARIVEAIERNGAALRPAPLPINRYTSGGLLRFMTAEQHKRYREQLRDCMSNEVVERNDVCVRQLVTQWLAEIARVAGASDTGTGLEPYVDDLAFDVCAKIFLGLGRDEERRAALIRLYRVVDHRRPWLRPASTRRGMAELVTFVKDQSRRLGETGGYPTSFLGVAMEKFPSSLDDPVFVENLAFFLHIARSDLSGLLGWLIKMLIDHPDCAKRIRDDPRDADSFVFETLRLRQSEYLYRRTVKAIEIGDFVIPRGWLVRFCIRESHTDPNLYGDPNRFDPGRFSRGQNPDNYRPFGLNEHACLGVPLTLGVGRVLVQILASDYDLELLRDGPIEGGLRHHAHWRPSSRLRFRMAARH